MAPESRFHTILKAKLLSLRTEREHELVDGVIEDYPSYRFYVGILMGLNDALKLCEETEREFDV